MIVITTPTGRIGRQLVDRLLEHGEEVRLIARDPSRIDDHVAERTQIISGSHADPGVLDRALPGADALFWLVPPDPAASSALAHYLGFAREAASAIRRHDVGHVVAVTSAGHGWPKDAGILSAAFAMDDELRTSGAAFRALSLPFYMENLLSQAGSLLNRGSFSLTCAADRPLPMIATKDIAAKAAELLSDRSWQGQADLPYFGPDRLTPDEMARTMSEVLGRNIAYERMTMEDFAALLGDRGASEQAVEETVAMFAAQDEGIYDDDAARGASAPTDFRTWCAEVLRPRLESC